MKGKKNGNGIRPEIILRQLKRISGDDKNLRSKLKKKRSQEKDYPEL